MGQHALVEKYCINAIHVFYLCWFCVLFIVGSALAPNSVSGANSPVLAANGSPLPTNVTQT